MAKVENPTKMDEMTVKKLEEAFAIDSTVEEACFYAGISKQTYYNWIGSFPDKKEQFDALRQRPVLLARQTAVKKLTESYSNAMDYLSRKKKDEFSPRQEQTGANGGAIEHKIINEEEFQKVIGTYATNRGSENTNNT